MRWVSLIVVGFLLGTAVSAAESDGPRLAHTAIGFNVQFRNRSWTPLVVRVENPGPARKLTILAEAPGKVSGQRTAFKRVVWVPENATRQVEFPVFPDLLPDPDDDQNPIKTIFNVSLTDGRAHVWDRLTVLGTPHPEESFSALVADSRFRSYLFLKGTSLPETKRPLARWVTEPALLPERPLSYAGVDALILGDLSGTNFTPLQHRALRDWLRSGGHLIVVPGPTLPDAWLADLLPVRYVSTHTVETLPVVAPGAHFPRGVIFTRMLVHDGTIEMGDANRPVIVSRREGLGRVTALAFDAGADDFRAWDDAVGFWTDLLSAPAAFRDADRILERSDAVEGILSSLAGIKVLSRSGLLLYLVGSIGVLLTVIVGFRFTRTPEWGWVAAAGLAVVGSAVAVAVAARWKSQPSPFLTELFVATARSGSDSATVQAALGLFSPHEQTYRLETPQDSVALRAGPSHLAPPEQFTTEYEAKLAVPDLRVRAADIRVVYGRGSLGAVTTAAAVLDDPAARPAAVPVPTARVVVGAEGLRVQLANPTAHPLEDGFIKYNRLVLPLGDLAAGASRDREGIRAGSGAFSSQVVRGDADELRARLREVFFPEPVFSLQKSFDFEARRLYSLLRGRESVPMYFSWSDHNPAVLAESQPPVARRAQGVWAVESELSFEGDRLMAPRGVLELRLRSKAGITATVGEGCFFGTRPMQLLVEFALPDRWPDLAVDQMRIFLEFRGSAFQPVVSLAPAGLVPTAEPAIGQLVTQTGDGVFVVEDPARYFNPETRSLVVAVDIQAAPGTGVARETAIVGLNNWQVRGLDVELKGTVR